MDIPIPPYPLSPAAGARWRESLIGVLCLAAKDLARHLYETGDNHDGVAARLRAEGEHFGDMARMPWDLAAAAAADSAMGPLTIDTGAVSPAGTGQPIPPYPPADNWAGQRDWKASLRGKLWVAAATTGCGMLGADYLPGEVSAELYEKGFAWYELGAQPWLALTELIAEGGQEVTHPGSLDLRAIEGLASGPAWKPLSTTTDVAHPEARGWWRFGRLGSA